MVRVWVGRVAVGVTVSECASEGVAVALGVRRVAVLRVKVRVRVRDPAETVAVRVREGVGPVRERVGVPVTGGVSDPVRVHMAERM